MQIVVRTSVRQSGLGSPRVIGYLTLKLCDVYPINQGYVSPASCFEKEVC